MKKILTLFFGLILIGCGGGSSDPATSTTSTPMGMTNASTDAAKNITDTFATLNGSFSNPAGYTTEAWAEWGTTTAYGFLTTSLFYAYPANIRPSFDISSLTVGTTYHYKFCTQNSDGKWCGLDRTFSTIPMATKTTIVSGLTYPVQFAIDSNNIYWTEGGANGAVKKAPLGGGTATTLASLRNDPFGIAVDANNVYWTEQGSGTVNMVPIIGGAITPLATARSNPQFIAVYATNVYFTEFGTWNTAAGMRNADGTVNLVPIGGGAVIQLATALDGPQTIRVDAVNVYWTELANFVSGAGTIKSAPVGGGVVTTLVSGLSNSRNIALEASNVYYWSGYGTIARVPIGGATPTNPIVEVTTSMNGTQPLDADATDVYWTDGGASGTVKRLNKTSGDVTVLTSGLNNTQGIALDASSIYWMEADTFNGVGWNNSGALYKISK